MTDEVQTKTGSSDTYVAFMSIEGHCNGFTSLKNWQDRGGDFFLGEEGGSGIMFDGPAFTEDMSVEEQDELFAKIKQMAHAAVHAYLKRQSDEVHSSGRSPDRG
jgi:hypothetical protein